MVFKTFFMLSLYIVPYVLILTCNFSSISVLLMWALIGFGMSGIGLSIMHDANHNAYSKNKNVNKWMGYFLNIVGGYDINWRIQHNVLHHTYTNIIGMDEDVDAGIVLRFTKDQNLKPYHRLQHIYAWFLYGLMTIQWSFDKDFLQLIRYHKNGLLKIQKRNFTNQMALLIFYKVIYYSYVLVLPLIFLDNWWLVIIGYLTMHYTAGLILSVVFQCAHVMEPNDFNSPNESRVVDKNLSLIHISEPTRPY